ncbi:putative transcription factor [Myxozyma melibiosi]|uniref:Transcription factor n=1 Tax=Myxozyma melibiosi TaxID=54550 RepID=A0ABR1FDQ2_9ASCO
MTLFAAKVKAALSGDTLVLTPARPPQPGKAPSERILALAYVSAPRIRRDEPDEPFAFQSREHLRLLLVGQVVQCEVLYTVPSSNREYGVVYLTDPDGSRSNVAENLISSGTVRVRDRGGKPDAAAEQNDLLDRYRALESAAAEAAFGVHSSQIESFQTLSEIPADFVATYKGKSLEAIVERIFNGDRILARIVLPGLHIQVPLLLAGIRAPRSSPSNPDSPDNAEPYGDIAKLYVEARLLQRSVTVEVLGASQQGALIAVVRHPAGVIAEKLLEAGLASVSDWQSNILGAAAMGTLRTAERTARAKGLNIWHGTTVAASSSSAGSGSDKSYSAVVARIISADTLVVRNAKTNDEKVVQLASVRGPRASDPKQQSYVAAAREFVRKLAIGKHVKVTLLHTRPKSDNFDERDIVTVELAKAPAGHSSPDLATIVVEAGYATVIRHRKGEVDDRSPIWDELLEKEGAAIKAKAGFHSGVALPPDRVVNASESNARAAAFLPSLQRQKRVPAIVEFVNTGSRLRLLLPRENARIKFILAGITTPRVAMANSSEKSEPFGDEAREFSARRLLQRDVEIDVTHADHSGGFFGLLHVPGTKDTFAKALLEEGLATFDEYSAQEAGVASQFRAAEEVATQAKKGIWKEDKGKAKAAVAAPVAAPVAAAAAVASGPSNKEYLNIAVTHVADDGSFSYVILNDSLTKLKSLTSTLSSTAPAPLANARPRVGDLVSYILPETTLPARFKVASLDIPKKQASLVSIDFGTKVPAAPFAKLRALPPSCSPATSGVPALARPGVLRIVKFPEFADEYLDDAVTVFYDLVWTAPEVLVSSAPGTVKRLVAVTDGTSNADGVPTIELVDAAAMDKSINARLAEDGWVYVPSDKALRRSPERVVIGSDTLSELRRAAEAAKLERKGIWEYGDATPDDE